MRKTIYLAGPISKGDLKNNVDQATAAFVALAKAGFAPFCPHWSVYSKPVEEDTRTEECANYIIYGTEPYCRKCKSRPVVICEATVEGNDQMVYDDWIGIDLAWVAQSDALLRLPGESTGADMEVECAHKHSIPVFTNIDELIGYFIAQKIHAEVVL